MNFFSLKAYSNVYLPSLYTGGLDYQYCFSLYCFLERNMIEFPQNEENDFLREIKKPRLLRGFLFSTSTGSLKQF